MLVLWSGGLDSTVALLQMLDECQSNGTLSNVRTVSVNHQSVCAWGEQLAARRKILAFIKKRYSIVLKNHEVRIRYKGLSAVSRCLPQPVIWFTSVMPFLGMDEDLVVGWHRGDDAMAYHDCVSDVFRSVSRALGKTGSIRIPLEYERKQDVIARAKTTGVYDLCFWCESPTRGGKACGKCEPCINHAAGLFIHQHRGK